MSNEFDFSSLEIREVPVISPDGIHLTLREATGKAATTHRNAIMSATKFGPNGRVTGMKDLAIIEAKFLASCLWDSEGRNITHLQVEEWPDRVKKKLYQKLKELSDMNETETPLKKALESALSGEDSPVPLTEFKKYVASLEGSKFKPLVDMFDEEDEAKN